MQLPTRAATPVLSAHLEGDSQPFSDVSYLDDLAWAITAPASRLTASLAEAASLTTDIFERYGLTVNFAPGKSEAIAVWR
eukprot:1261780-Lingulodinium_polyedra.AAC.1